MLALKLQELNSLSPDNHWEAVRNQCVKDCSLDEDDVPSDSSFVQDSGSAYLGFRRWLADVIQHWMRTDLEKLAQALYRSDLSRQQVSSLFEAWNLDDEAAAWAEVLIRKSLHKVLLRNYYSSK